MIKEELEKEADDYAEKHAFRVPYDGSNKFYDDVDFKASKEGYLAGAKPREKRIAELEAQIEKMKRCANCKYIYCPTSSKSEKDGKVLFHNWNKEKQAYCDCGNGEGEKYQLWEIKENDN